MFAAVLGFLLRSTECNDDRGVDPTFYRKAVGCEPLHELTDSSSGTSSTTKFFVPCSGCVLKAAASATTLSSHKPYLAAKIGRIFDRRTWLLLDDVRTLAKVDLLCQLDRTRNATTTPSLLRRRRGCGRSVDAITAPS